jgi:hypothetical protein
MAGVLDILEVRCFPDTIDPRGPGVGKTHLAIALGLRAIE